jgi:membrane protein
MGRTEAAGRLRTGSRRVRALLGDTTASLRGHDLALVAAGVTFYAGIALVPSLLVALWLASLLAGPDTVLALADSLAAALPEALGAPEAARRLVDAGVGLAPVSALVAAIPATLYGEGLRRAFVSLRAAADERTGWRGRARVAPLFAAAPVLTLAVLLVTPTLARLFTTDRPGPTALGIYIALNVDWVVLSVVLGYVYRVVGPRAPGWRALVWGAASTGAFASGFVQGFVLFLALPVDLGAPFGGLPVVGVVVALGFWLWLLHLVTLFGYALTWRLDERGGSPWALPQRTVERG